MEDSNVVDAALVRAVLDNAAGLFALTHNASGTAAIIHEFIRRKNLFTQAGFTSMKAFDAQKLGVRTKSHRDKITRAGKAAWAFYQYLCNDVLERVARGDTPGSPGFPEVPCESVLAALAAAAERVHAEEGEEGRERLLRDVLAGTYRAEDLDKAGRQSENDDAEAESSDDSDGADDESEEAAAPSDELPEYLAGAAVELQRLDERFRRPTPGTLPRAQVKVAVDQWLSVGDALALQLGTTISALLKLHRRHRDS